MRGVTVAALCLVVMAATSLWAKLPPPTEEQKAAAAAKAAKAAAAAKRDSELLGKAQDAVVDKYKKKGQSAKAKAEPPAMEAPAVEK